MLARNASDGSFAVLMHDNEVTLTEPLGEVHVECASIVALAIDELVLVPTADVQIRSESLEAFP